MLRKSVFFLCSLLLLYPSQAFAEGAADTEELPLHIRPALVMEADSGKILFAKKPFVRWAPASLTKMMTAYTVFRQIELGHISMKSPVRISEEALAQPPSKMGLPIGTIMTVETALSIIMVKSANDVSVALGESVGGSEEKFVDLMNSHARRLGMTDTNFANPHGLHEPEQFTSARDMAVLSQTLTKEFEKYDRFFNIPAVKIGKRRLRNHNALLERFPGTNGMKTGYVCASGFNVVVRTKREGREIIAVVLGGRSGLARNVRAAKLLEEAFSDQHKGEGETLAGLRKAEGVSLIPEDITSDICPWKTAALPLPQTQPDPRPDDAPKSEDFDPIDTQLPPDDNDEEASDVETVEVAIIVPEKRPKNSRSSTGVQADATASQEKPVEDENAIPEDEPPTLAELAEVYLTERQKTREDVSLSLNGATGPNPNGVKTTDGGRYVAPTPVPTKRVEAEEQGS